MTGKVYDNLSKYKILLGSKSPRRKELMEQLCLPFEVITIDGVEEVYPSTLAVERVPEFLANLKADAFKECMAEDVLLITADTVVINDGVILGKPVDADDAERMLAAISGKTHKVVTGVSILSKDKHLSFSVSTDVTFAPISKEEISFYVKRFSPLDKAGAYGIQEWIGCAAVSSISGSFYNVMGLPVHRLYHELKNF
jgi:septum formation protein